MLYESFNDTFENVPVKVYRHDLTGKYIWAPMHWHRSLELFVSFEGRNYLNIGRNDFVFTDTDWTIINSSELHSVRYYSSTDRFKGISIIISLPFIEKWIGKNVYFYNPSDPVVTEKIHDAAMAIYQLDESAEYYSLKLMKYSMELVALLAEYCTKKDVVYKIPFNKAQSKGTAFLNYIEENYARDLSLNEIAEHFQYTPSYFSRFFKETVGVNYHSYLNYVRVHHAAQILQTSDITLTDCALANGFPNVKSFIHMFKQIYGCTPKVFLKK